MSCSRARRRALPVGLGLGLLLLAAVAAADGGAGVGPSTGAGFVPPRLEAPPRPEYPAALLAERLEGEVLLRLEVTDTGRVATASVTASPHPLLSEAALAAVRALHFEPARFDGEPVAVTVRYGLRFVPPPSVPAPGSTSTAAPARRSAPEIAATDPRPDLDPPPPDHEAPVDQLGDGYAVRVSGRRPPRSATDFPIALGVGPAAAVAASAAELLARAPGVHLSQHSGEGKGQQIFLRGFDAVHGQDVEVRAGGLPVNEPSNVHAQGYVDLNHLPPELVLRLRALEGPFDPRQGDFAVAGSLELELGLEHRGVLARTSVGQFGLRRALVAWGPEEASTETFVGAELVAGEGFGPARAWRRANVLGQWQGSLGGGLSLRLLGTAHTGRFDSAGAVRLDDVESGRLDRFAVGRPDQGGATERHQVLVELERDTALDRSSLALHLGWRALRLRSDFTGFFVDPRGDRVEQDHEALTVGGRALHRRRLGARLELELGASWRHDRVELDQARLRALDGVPYRRERDDRLLITDVGLWLDAELGLGAFALRGGGRLEAFGFQIEERLAADGLGDRREAFGLHLAPRLTAEWRALPALRLFLSYGNGFRSPPAAILGSGERSPLAVVNAGELGARWRLGSRAVLSAAGFVTHVADDLVFDHATAATLSTGPTLRAGGVLVARAEPWPWLSLSASATWTRAVKPEDGGSLVPFVPPLVGRLRADLRAPVATLLDHPLEALAGLELRGFSPRPLPFSETGAGALIPELWAGLAWDLLTLSAELYNPLDTEWRDGEFVYASDLDPSDASSRLPARHFTAGRPRSAQLTLTLRI